MADWIPNYIRKNIEYKPHEILTAKEFNALLNLIITQGDYNSSWLNYLQVQGIPKAIEDLSVDQIKEALTDAVKEELSALASSVTNKTSAHLNAPVFVFLDLSVQTDMSNFRSILETYNLPGTFCAATNLIGRSDTYPTLLTLQAMQLAGHEIVTVGTDTASLDTLTLDEVETVATNAQSYMEANLTDTGVFVYPGGTSSTTAQSGVGSVYKYAINSSNSTAVIDSDDLYDDLRLQLPIVLINSTNTISTDSIKTIIDDTVTNNKCCIIAVDTSATTYDAATIISVIEYIKGNAGITYSTASEAMILCENTINNQLKGLVNGAQGWYIDYKDESGTVQTEKYLHW